MGPALYVETVNRASARFWDQKDEEPGKAELFWCTGFAARLWLANGVGAGRIPPCRACSVAGSVLSALLVTGHTSRNPGGEITQGGGRALHSGRLWKARI
jgi:hypothetical protein